MYSVSKTAKNVVLDVLAIIVILVIFAIVSMVAFIPLDNINSAIQEDTTFDSTAKATLQENTTNYPTLFDGLIITAMVLLWILTLLSAFFIDSHPAFFVVSLILLIIVVMTGVYLGNMTSDIVNTEGLNGDKFPMTSQLFDNLGLIILIIGVSLCIVIYAKVRAG